MYVSWYQQGRELEQTRAAILKFYVLVLADSSAT